MQRQASEADLFWLNMRDILAGFGVPPVSALSGLLTVALHQPATRFATQLAALDQLVALHGLPAGSHWIVQQLAERLVVRGPQPPPTGPLLVLANHPGLLDACALLTAIGRSDLRFLAVPRPFLRALPNIANAVIPVGESAAQRGAALRTAARHLRDGGALLTFPAGQIEPDPRISADAEASLAHWSGSLDLLVRLAGNATVVPAIVGGVIAPAALRHPIVYLRRNAADRRWLAAIWQLLWPRLGRTTVHVRFGAALPSTTPHISAHVVATAAQLIREIRHQ
jgi:1-acyl-sn-glycerol-3-phosphate acyltransferase